MQLRPVCNVDATDVVEVVIADVVELCWGGLSSAAKCRVVVVMSVAGLNVAGVESPVLWC